MKFSPLSLLTLLVIPTIGFAEENSFSDLPKDHYAYEAVEYLKSQNIISGYEDGTFQPEKSVNRAEALKIIVAPLITEEQLAQAKEANTVYTDIENDSWFKPYVELARAASIIDGPPKKEEFKGGDPVIKVEFMKMVQEAFGAKPKTAFSEIKLPLSQDVTNTDEWFYPYMRYGISTSMIMISGEGTLTPAKQLTRGETAVILYRYIMYEQKRRTQALLSEAESEILIILSFLEQNDINEAEYASARALIAARGAHAAKPDESIVQGAVKITEAFRALVRGYRSGVNKDFEETVRLAGEAWNLSDRAIEKNSELTDIAKKVQVISKNMADSARAKTGEASE
ncbi:MAG: S-layer homology domain-containing protein [bacterium]|nr:S-layer homology domain-containing protein [bacterium]MDA1292634.1 S-layer homology domain-containing protein [bacterium]